MPKFRRLLPIIALAAVGTAAHALPAMASTTQDAILQDDGSLQANPVGTLQTMRTLGVTRVRVGVYWGNIAPGSTSRRRPAHFNASDPGAYGNRWATYDQIVLHYYPGTSLGPAPASRVRVLLADTRRELTVSSAAGFKVKQTLAPQSASTRLTSARAARQSSSQ